MFDFFKRGKAKESSAHLETVHADENIGSIDIVWDKLGFTGTDNKDANTDICQYMPESQLVNSSINKREMTEKNEATIEKKIECIRNAFAEKYNEYSLPKIGEKNDFVSDISFLKENAVYKKPPMLALNKYKLSSSKEMKDISYGLYNFLQANGIGAAIELIEHTGNVYTFGLKLETGVRVNTIVKEKDEISVTLGGSVVFEVPLQGTSLLGIHIQLENESVCLRQCLESKEFQECKARIPLLIGVSDHGEMVVDDLDMMGHLLIGGTSGSGKSVLINTLLLGLLYKTEPKDIRFILIDTSVLNLSVYNDIPQLVVPVITEPRKALWALNWCCDEIKDRNQKMTDARCKDIDDYNVEFSDSGFPHIVVIIDEFGPVIGEDGALEAFQEILVLGKQAGIHLILATQKIHSLNTARMFRDYVSARISLNVFSEAESKSFLGVSGAEKLKGQGDMLYRRPGSSALLHVYGIDTKDEEAVSTVGYIKDFNRNYAVENNDKRDLNVYNLTKIIYDPLLFEAGLTVIENGKASIGLLQRTFKIGFNRAANMMDQLCELGVVGEAEETKPRKVVMTIEQFCAAIDNILYS